MNVELTPHILEWVSEWGASGPSPSRIEKQEYSVLFGRGAPQHTLIEILTSIPSFGTSGGRINRVKRCTQIFCPSSIMHCMAISKNNNHFPPVNVLPSFLSMYPLPVCPCPFFKSGTIVKSDPFMYSFSDLSLSANPACHVYHFLYVIHFRYITDVTSGLSLSLHPACHCPLFKSITVITVLSSSLSLLSLPSYPCPHFKPITVFTSSPCHCPHIKPVTVLTSSLSLSSLPAFHCH